MNGKNDDLFGLKIAKSLDQGLEGLDSNIQTRLQAARALALDSCVSKKTDFDFFQRKISIFAASSAAAVFFLYFGGLQYQNERETEIMPPESNAVMDAREDARAAQRQAEAEGSEN